MCPDFPQTDSRCYINWGVHTEWGVKPLLHSVGTSSFLQPRKLPFCFIFPICSKMGSEDSVSCTLDRGSLRLLFGMFALLAICVWLGTTLRLTSCVGICFLVHYLGCSFLGDIVFMVWSATTTVLQSLLIRVLFLLVCLGYWVVRLPLLKFWCIDLMIASGFAIAERAPSTSLEDAPDFKFVTNDDWNIY